MVELLTGACKSLAEKTEQELSARYLFVVASLRRKSGAPSDWLGDSVAFSYRITPSHTKGSST